MTAFRPSLRDGEEPTRVRPSEGLRVTAFRPPLRDGVEPTRVRLPDGPWATVVEYLTERFPEDAGSLPRRLAAGELLDADGRPITVDTGHVAGATLFVHRDLPVEVPVPGELTELYRDDAVLVVDKPHFLATMPRGSHVAETALVRVRRMLAAQGHADLVPSPAHRLDRLTAGVLLFTLKREVRGAYQELFARGLADKTYLAVTAAPPPGAVVPATIIDRLEKVRGTLQARQVPGEPNATTDLQLLALHDGKALWRLFPRTGKTHQLRVHLSSLGLPILGDSLYPEVIDVAPEDFSTPLQLVAETLSFNDPLSGKKVRLVSRRTPTRWSHPVPPPAF